MKPIKRTYVSKHRKGDDILILFHLIREQQKKPEVSKYLYRPFDNTLEKEVDVDNFFYKYKGYAIAYEVLDLARRNHCEKIVLKEIEDGYHVRTLLSYIEDWYGYLDEPYQQLNEIGEPIFEEQLILPVEQMIVTWDAEEDDDGDRQETLF